MSVLAVYQSTFKFYGDVQKATRRLLHVTADLLESFEIANQAALAASTAVLVLPLIVTFDFYDQTLRPLPCKL